MVGMKFWKMHGLGNDYVVIDDRKERIDAVKVVRLAEKLCERKLSVGADGLLLLSNSKLADVRMRIFNADGSEAETCGNGLRCLVKYCYENDVVRKKELRIETRAGIKTAWPTVINNEVRSVKVDMGEPILDRKAIPMLGWGTCIDESLEIEGKTFTVNCLSVGNPHCVILVNDVQDFPVHDLGPKIETLEVFPEKTNVEFMQVLNRDEAKIRVWERGCGETLACGTGACASVAAANLLHKVNNKVTVHMLGGELTIEYAGSLSMTGPAEKVFEGIMF